MTKKVLVIGSESTGKSTLTEKLSAHYKNKGLKVGEIQEFAREWIDDKLDGDMNKLEFDFITMFGQTQMALVRLAERLDKCDIVISDTDAIVSYIFQQIYYGKVDPDLVKEVEKEEWDLVLFTQPDVPWVDDGQRDLGNRREEVNQMFKEALHKHKMNYVEIKGNWDERFEIATKAVDSTLI